MANTKIQLKPLEWKDWKTYLAWVNEPGIMQLIDRYLPVSELEHQDFYRKLLKDKTQIFFAVKTPAGKFLGVCALKHLDLKNRKAELYICLNGKGVRGRGLGQQAVGALLDYGFETLNLNRIYLYTPAFNKAALACYRRCGFKTEGVLKEDLFSGGRYHDAVRMAFLRRFRKKVKPRR